MIPDEEKYHIVRYEKSCVYDIVVEYVEFGVEGE